MKSRDDEGAGEALAVGHGAIVRPGQDGLVADILVDLGVAFQSGVGDVAEEVVQQLMEADGAQPLGKPGRVLHVDQQEDPLLALRLDIAAGQQVLERAVAQQAADLEQRSCRTPTWRWRRRCDDREKASRRKGVCRDHDDDRRTSSRPPRMTTRVEQQPSRRSRARAAAAATAARARAPAPELEQTGSASAMNSERDDARQAEPAAAASSAGCDGIAEAGADDGARDVDPEEDPPCAAVAPRQGHAAGARERAARRSRDRRCRPSRPRPRRGP